MTRILIVDDEKKARQLLSKFMSPRFVRRKFEVETAKDGEEAIEKVESFRPHLVLLDVVMPGVGGLEALPRLKALDPNVRIIMVTGVDDIEVAEMAIKQGADDYITKPVDLHSLLNSIHVQLLQGEIGPAEP